VSAGAYGILFVRVRTRTRSISGPHFSGGFLKGLLQDFMTNIFKYCLLFALLLARPALGIDLYSGEVAVADQGARERLKSVPAALIQVLQKHSGQRELPLHPALDAALSGANRIMISFYYREHERVSPDGTVNTEWRLVANFLPEAVDQVIRDLELPRWRAERRPITIWIVVDDGRGRRLLPLEYEYARDALSDVAGIRGLPIAWPDLDDEQMQQEDLQLLWGGFTDELPQVQGKGDVVIVAARREGAVWNVRWNYAGGGETSGWRIRDTDLSFALVDGLHRLTDLVAARDAIAPSAQGLWHSELQITGLLGADDYARCLAYLESLSVVEQVNVAEAGPGAVRFLLDLNALPEYLENELDRDAVLVAGTFENEYSLVHAIAPQPEDPGVLKR
jgi:hypothetical protein